MGKTIQELHKQKNAVNTHILLFLRSLTLLYKCTNRTLLGFCIHTISVSSHRALWKLPIWAIDVGFFS